MKEINSYVTIKDYPDYSINRQGTVLSIFANSPHGRVVRKKDYQLKVNISKTTGYASIALYKDGLLKRFFLHRLVAITFLPNPENKPEVNHLDGNKLNNNIDNLEWATKKENAQHSIIVLGKKGPRAIPVKNTITGEVFESIKYAAVSINMKNATLACKLRGRHKNDTNLAYANTNT